MIYLDNNASTPMDPRVIERMTHVMRECHANPSSTLHGMGRQAAELIETARRQVAALIGAGAKDVIFTSGATESCNLAIKGTTEMHRARGNRLVTCLAEHKAVLNPFRRLENQGFHVTWLRPDGFGRISAHNVQSTLTDQTILLSVSAANSVVGTINPIAEIGNIAKRRGVAFHCDATQAVGKMPVDVRAMNVDLLSFSSHKLYGPKGVGALFLRSDLPKIRITPQIDGGGQEFGLRGGTLNVPGIVGFGLACEIARNNLEIESRNIKILCDRFWTAISNRLPNVFLNGHPLERLPNTLNITFAGVDAAELLRRLPEIAASVGSACTSGTDDPHYVLRAMGISEDTAAGSIRY
jgi:cysteine desulfurase